MKTDLQRVLERTEREADAALWLVDPVYAESLGINPAWALADRLKYCNNPIATMQRIRNNAVRQC